MTRPIYFSTQNFLFLFRRFVYFLVFGLFILNPLYAQHTKVSGHIIDEQTGEFLAFVHIIINDSYSGTTSGIDGSFSLTYSGGIRSLRLSYVGYTTEYIMLQDYLSDHPDQKSSGLIFKMKRETRMLNELVFEAGENPAYPIIRKVVENRNINNPEKIKSFQYKSYNKFYVDAENFDSDSSFQEFLTKRYLFLMESVTERKYIRPDRSKETVLANRVSGFKSPIFTTLANSFQPFSFYGDYISVAGKNYLNPISKGSTKKYFFSLEDSIYSGENKVYLISFEPMKKNFDGLKGILYINTYKYAIENVIAETSNLAEKFINNEGADENPSEEEFNPFKFDEKKAASEDLDEMDETDQNEENEGIERNEGTDRTMGTGQVDETDTTRMSGNDDFESLSITFKIQQKYELIDNEFWFPTQLNTDILIGDATGTSDAALKGIGRSYLTEIVLLPELRKREFDRMALEFDPKATKRDSTFWMQYRVEPLSQRGKETYNYIDSIGKEANLDRIVTGLGILTTGKIRMGKINWDAEEFVKINRYEAVRLGIGLHTNQSFSEFFNIGGYGGYGFLDKAFKYGGDLNIFLTDKNEITLFGLYRNDLSEFGGTRFYLDNNPLSSELNRQFMIADMDEFENMEVGIEFYFLKYLDTRIAFSKSNKKPTNDYLYSSVDSDLPILYNVFNFAEMKISLKYSFREKYVEVLGNKISVGTKYPIIWANYTKGFNDISAGGFAYEKWDLKIQKSFLIRGFGKPSITIKAGLATGNVPAPNLFNGNGSNAWQIPLEAANSFNTMGLNEFLSERFAALYYTHSLGTIKINPKRSTPEFLLITNIGWGALKHPERHQNIEFNTMEKGYYESGISIRNLYKTASIIGFGVAGFYRYGPYSHGREINNITAKLTLHISL